MAGTKSIGKLLYSPAQVSEWLSIPKTTLYRWEKLGEISRAERAPNGERVYRWHQIKQIANRARAQVRSEVDLYLREDPDGEFPPTNLMERLYKIEYFGTDDPEHGLEQLEGLAKEGGLTNETSRSLIKDALSRPRGDKTRAEVWKILLADAEYGS